jgi:hypothetical protein
MFLMRITIALIALLLIPAVAAASACTKDGDPGFYLDFEEESRDVYPGQTVTWIIGPTNLGPWPGTCPDFDTFCIHVTDELGWTIEVDPEQGICFILDPAYLYKHNVSITVPLDATPGVGTNVLTAVMSYCNSILECVPDCGDCEDPNEYPGKPCYSTITVQLNVLEEPHPFSIVQDDVTYVGKGCGTAFVPFEICNENPDDEDGTAFHFEIKSNGTIGPAVHEVGVVTILGGTCRTVYGVLDAHLAEVDDTDKLSITVWVEPGMVPKTCSQDIRVLEQMHVPLLSPFQSMLLAAMLILVAALHIGKRRCGGMPVRPLLLSIIFLCLLAAFPQSLHANKDDITASVPVKGPPIAKSVSYVIVSYDFESLDWQGWRPIDNTEQLERFFHVDDFGRLDGGSKNGLTPIQGTRSMWCGDRPLSDPNHIGPADNLCHWVADPGYGDQWNQILSTHPIQVHGPLEFEYALKYDTEPDNDFVYIEYDTGFGRWTPLAFYSGEALDQIVERSHRMFLSCCWTKLRIRFKSDHTWSDEDGLYDSDGAVIVDELRLSDDRGEIDHEDFETWPPFAREKEGSIWRAEVMEPFGAYAGLKDNLYDNDPCCDDLTSKVVFFVGSMYPSADYPGLFDTPFCMGYGNISEPCQNEMVVSPVIDMTKYSLPGEHDNSIDIPPEMLNELNGASLSFSVYRDNPMENCVFYYWLVRSIVDGCPQLWRPRYDIYYTDHFCKEFLDTEIDISSYIDGNLIQVALGVWDLCDLWYDESTISCTEHTPAPLFDNVRIERYRTVPSQ